MSERQAAMTTRERSITRVIEQIEIRRELLARLRSGDAGRISNPDSTETQRLTGLQSLLTRVSTVTPLLDEASFHSAVRTALLGPVFELAAGAVLWLGHYQHNDEILTCILHERERQDEQYGASVVSYRASEWAAALTEEVGEVAREAFRAGRQQGHQLAEELVQVAALAVWWLELLQREGRA